MEGKWGIFVKDMGSMVYIFAYFFHMTYHKLIQVNAYSIHNTICCPEEPNLILLRYAMVFMLLETSSYLRNGISNKHVSKER